MLATYSFLPVVQAFASSAGVDVETRDISLAGRILAALPRAPHRGAADHRRPRRAGRPRHQARGQHHQAAQRLGVDAAAQGRHRGAAEPGLRPPRLPRRPADRRGARRSRARYDKVKGSAVNPVLREGNSDRRAPLSGEELRPQPPALDGRLEHRQQDQRRAPWASTTSATTSSRSCSAPTTPSPSSHVATDGTVTELRDAAAGARGRGRRRHRAARRRPRRLPHRTRSPAPRPTTCSSPCTSRPR